MNFTFLKNSQNFGTITIFQNSAQLPPMGRFRNFIAIPKACLVRLCSKKLETKNFESFQFFHDFQQILFFEIFELSLH